jgi:hypothetical protein
VLTYYLDPVVKVTSKALTIDGRVFPLRDLGSVWHREADREVHGRRSKAREIWAIWNGQQLMLLRIADQTRFGQIYRAIQRAYEQNPE